jgi:hypothetical protein
VSAVTHFDQSYVFVKIGVPPETVNEFGIALCEGSRKTVDVSCRRYNELSERNTIINHVEL